MNATMKKMKWILPALVALTLVTAAISMTGCKDSKTTQSDAQARQYCCPMHPEVVKDKPGNCPKCGMALVEK